MSMPAEMVVVKMVGSNSVRGLFVTIILALMVAACGEGQSAECKALDAQLLDLEAAQRVSNEPWMAMAWLAIYEEYKEEGCD